MIVSDVDGTLIHEGAIPPRNVEAIRRFVEKGGRFGIATGRSRGTMREATGVIPVNAPCVLYNGGALYDYVNDRILWETFLPPESDGYVRTLMEEAPYTGVMIIKGDIYYRVRSLPAFEGYFEARDKENFAFSSVDELPRPWYKAVFQLEEENFPRFMETARSHGFPGVRFVGSYLTLAEMLPEHSNKGAALAKLVELGHVARLNLAAIGDFYNDLDMIRYAGIGATLSTAPDDIKAQADLVVGDVKSGAVADLIEHIESLCEG